MVLVDTSVWIAFFREKFSTAAKSLDTLLDEGEVCICGLIEAELIPGLRQNDRERVRSLLAGVSRIEIPPGIWSNTIKIQEDALARGLGPFSIPDLLLASLAVRNNFPVFSLDRHFEVLSRLTGITLWREKLPKELKCLTKKLD
jgi:predicted nucleic acid-binding protein